MKYLRELLNPAPGSDQPAPRKGPGDQPPKPTKPGLGGVPGGFGGFVSPSHGTFVAPEFKSSHPRFSETLARLLRMPLDQFEREGCLLQVHVRWLPVVLWWVPMEAAAEVLLAEGVSRGRIWTARELIDLLSIANLTAEQVQTIARAKLELGGEVVEVRRRAARIG